MVRAINTCFTAGLLQWIGFLGVFLIHKKILKNSEKNMAIVRSTPIWKPQLMPYGRSASNTINTQTTAPPTTLHRFFFQIRSRGSFSKNLRRIKIRSTSYIVILRILRIIVYRAL